MILVTGGTGMLGAHLLWQLCQEAEQPIRAIFRNEKSIEKVRSFFVSRLAAKRNQSPKTFFDKIEWASADITDKEALEGAFGGVRQVYHLAAVVSFDDADESLMQQVNAEGTANMVRLALKNKVSHFVHVSSIATLSNQKGKKKIDEQSIFNPKENNYPYASTKHLAETCVWEGISKGLPAVIFNPGVILGAGYWRENAGIFWGMVQKGFPFYATGITGFVGAEDVVRFMMASHKKQITGKRFILVAENWCYRDFLNAIAKHLKKRPPFIPLSSFVVKILVVLARFYALVSHNRSTITKDSLSFATNQTFYSNEKVKTTFKEGFTEMKAVVAELTIAFGAFN